MSKSGQNDEAVEKGPRFTPELDKRMVELVEKNLAVIEAGGKTSNANQKKNAMWKSIAEQINSENKTNFKPESCRRRWQYRT